MYQIYTKTVGEKHAYVQVLGWASVEVNDRREIGASTQYYKKWQASKMKINKFSQDTMTFLCCFSNE